MERQEMREYLFGLDPADRYPLWVISYNRAGDQRAAPFLKMASAWKTAEDVNVLVRESQVLDYMETYPALTIWSLPDSEIDNVGKARRAAMELALEETGPQCLLFDDDVLKLRFMFKSAITRGANAGKEKTAHSGVEDHEVMPDWEERILAGVTDVARRVFETYPQTVLGGMIKQHMSFSPKNHQTAFTVNGGVTPRQTMVFNLERMYARGVKLNTERFGIHGDDIGMAAEILAAGLDCFAMPSFAYDHWSEDINIERSVVRNAENKASMHAFEFEQLMKYPIKDYLRQKRSIIDGSYEWGDVNWAAAAKVRGRPTVQVKWDDLDLGLLI